jgi:hypothetical protein
MSYPSTPLEGTTPLISDRYIITCQAGAAITMGQLLYVYTDGTVKPTAAANVKNIIGFALTNQPTVGGKVSVVNRGICRGTAYGTITAGDQITSASGGSGGLIQTDNSSLNTTIIGIALQGASSGGTATILMW